MTRKERFDRLAQEYMQAFAKKQGLVFEFWVADEVCGTACFGDRFFDLDDMRYDLDHDLPMGMAVEWHDRIEGGYINLPSWSKGLRPVSMAGCKEVSGATLLGRRQPCPE